MKGLLESHDPAELRQIIDCLGIAAFVIDVEPGGVFRLAAINERHEQLTGMHHSQVMGQQIDKILPPEMAEQVMANYRRCVRQRTAIDYQESLCLPVGITYWRTTLVPYMDVDGRVFRLLGTSIEITSTVHLELESRYQSTVLSAYLDESQDGILVVDANNHIKTWNRRFLEMWDIPSEIMEAGDGRCALEVVSSQLKAPEEFVGKITELYKHLDHEEHGYLVEMLDGRLFERHSRGLRDIHGTYWGRIWFYRDVTEYMRMTKELQRLALTDPLTMIANRRAFMEALTEEYHRACRYGHPMTLLMIDLDEFKGINDRYGHLYGDEILKSSSAAMCAIMRETDFFARMGGEEFAMLLPETDITAGYQIAERLREAVASVKINSPQGSLGVTVSIGVAEMQSDDSEAEAILNRADRALYLAKDSGRNRVASI